MKIPNNFLLVVLIASACMPKGDAQVTPLQLANSRAGRTCAFQNQHFFCWGKSVYFNNQAGMRKTQTATRVRLTSLSVGEQGMCTIEGEGDLSCSSFYGHSKPTYPPALVDPSVRWKKVSAGDFPCALAQTGDITCWSSFDSKAPKQIIQGPWDELSVGKRHGCAIGAGDLYCWGDNQNGQLGIASDITWSTLPVAVSGSWKSVSAGEEHTCALSTRDALWCWGSNADHRLGIDAPANVLEPRLVSEHGWAVVSAGFNHTCAIDRDSWIWCWGGNRYSESRGEGETVDSPRRISSGWTSVAAGSFTTCAQKPDASVWCWGDTRYRKLGDDAESWIAKEPVRVEGGPWASATLGSNHACAVDKGSRAWCWGLNMTGQLGFAGEDLHIPRRVTESTGWSELKADDRKTCGIQAGIIVCWGLFFAEHVQGPFPVTDLTGVTQAAAGKHYLLALDAGGMLHYVSRQTDNTTSSFPADTSTSAVRWHSIETGDDTGCGITRADEIRCWGILGPKMTSFWAPISQATVWGTPGSRWSHVSTEGLASFMDWDLYDYTATLCAISGAGVLSCADLGDYGRFPFAPIAEETVWRDVDVSLNRFCAISADGELWCWGWPAEKGVLVFPHGSPKQVGSEHAWDRVWLSSAYACALRNDNSLWCWGDNTFGQLGTANTGTPVPHKVHWSD